ncbi:MAG: molybdopterin molybdotransferase MoeA, partial [Candidatus Acidiferrales bacterium]
SMLSYQAARAKVVEVIRERCAAASSGSETRRTPAVETIDLAAEPARALGRFLAENILADRSYPPFHRSTRDGFAVRAEDASQPGAKLRLIGESRAGVPFDGELSRGDCIEIMTGAALPRGADAVVMLEHVQVEGNTIRFDRVAQPGQNYVPEGAEMHTGDTVLRAGTRLGYAELAAAAQVGVALLKVARRPRVAILSTGDEVTDIGAKPGNFQVRNSNSITLAAQTALGGGEPVMLGNAADHAAAIRSKIERGLAEDILVLSGGVSAGKHDLVEPVLRELGAEFFFDAVAMRPGRPAVFGWCQGKPVFGLPGNPVSTMVTFELFVLPAVELLSGHSAEALPLFKARLQH